MVQGGTHILSTAMEAWLEWLKLPCNIGTDQFSMTLSLSHARTLLLTLTSLMGKAVTLMYSEAMEA
jgi:hypothetical protein